MKQGCQGFLVTVLKRERVEAKIEDIQVVKKKEYPEVFPEDLLGLPPDREVKFVINILPGITPVSKAP